MKRKILGLILLFGLVVMGSGAWGDIPRYINFQGKLMSGGVPITAAGNSLTIAIYDTPDVGTGTKLWERRFANLDLPGGIFNINIGPLDKTIDNRDFLFDKPYWLEITVSDRTTLPRRQQLLTSPYALRADSARVADRAVIADSLAGGGTGDDLYVKKQGPALILGNLTVTGDTTLGNPELIGHPDLVTTLTNINGKLKVSDNVYIPTFLFVGPISNGSLTPKRLRDDLTAYMKGTMTLAQVKERNLNWAAKFPGAAQSPAQNPPPKPDWLEPIISGIQAKQDRVQQIVDRVQDSLQTIQLTPGPAGPVGPGGPAGQVGPGIAEITFDRTSGRLKYRFPTDPPDAFHDVSGALVAASADLQAVQTSVRDLGAINDIILPASAAAARFPGLRGMTKNNIRDFVRGHVEVGAGFSLPADL